MITALIVLSLILFFVVFCVFKNLYYTAGANEVMILTGSQTRTRSGLHGYRLVKGGRTIRIPLLETIDRLSLSNISIDVKVRGAYSKGGIPLIVDGVANVKISGEEPYIHFAIERFLGKSMKEIEAIAQQTLEGNLRGVLASMTPEQVNQDKTSFARNLMAQAEADLHKLGLELDNLKIQNVTDDKGYLDSIGRIRSAELQKNATIAEAESKADAAIKAANAKLGIALSQVQKEAKIAQANAEKRIKIAQTNRVAMINEVQSATGTQMAKAKADLAVQQARIVQVQKQLEADFIQPTLANAEAAIQEAKGNAAKIIADGRASANALMEMTNTWKAAGPNARDVFLMPKLQGIVKTLVSNTINDIHIEKVSMIQGATPVSLPAISGMAATANTPNEDPAAQLPTATKAIPQLAAPLPTRLHQFNEQMKATVGLDVNDVINQIGNLRKG